MILLIFLNLIVIQLSQDRRVISIEKFILAKLLKKGGAKL
jgi:hypothetical protein